MAKNGTPNVRSISLFGMKITVVTVTYNCAAVLQAAIDSVAGQTYPHVEYIVVDGGSTDGTVEIIRQNAAQITRWVSEPDGGIYDAMNKGIAMATGDFIYFLGGDDRLYPEVLGLVAAQMKDLQSVYYGDVCFVGDRHGVYDGVFNRNKLIRRNICHQAIFYPCAVLSEGKKYDLAYKTYADYVFNMELWGSGVRFVYLGLVVADFRVGGASISGDALFFERRKALIRKYFGAWAAIYYTLRIEWANWMKRQILRRNG